MSIKHYTLARAVLGVAAALFLASSAFADAVLVLDDRSLDSYGEASAPETGTTFDSWSDSDTGPGDGSYYDKEVFGNAATGDSPLHNEAFGFAYQESEFLPDNLYGFLGVGGAAVVERTGDGNEASTNNSSYLEFQFLLASAHEYEFYVETFLTEYNFSGAGAQIVDLFAQVTLSDTNGVIHFVDSDDWLDSAGVLGPGLYTLTAHAVFNGYVDGDGGVVDFDADLFFDLFLTPLDTEPIIPEPTTLALLSLGMGGLAVRRWRASRT